ncbi:MAG: ABC transporter ATP-binding protein [Hyphomicrobium sp.]|nr:ABC transporter ATP-binding protein [Hyphomicrobium sp.]
MALVGHNGAGKTTLIKLILGLARPTSGTISVMGQFPGTSGFDTLRCHISFLPEQAIFQGSLTGRETLTFYARLKNAPTQGLDQLFQQVDLLEAAGRKVSTYSNGMRQRLGVAQALIGNPRILVLDEPTTGLDPDSRARVYAIIEERKADGVAVLLSSHALTELEARADRVAILHHGRLRACASIPELRKHAGLIPELRIKAGQEQMSALARHFAQCIEPCSFVNGVAVLNCPPRDKLIMLREILNLGLAIDDISLAEPNLEQIFAAYTDRTPAQ